MIRIDESFNIGKQNLHLDRLVFVSVQFICQSSPSEISKYAHAWKLNKDKAHSLAEEPQAKYSFKIPCL